MVGVFEFVFFFQTSGRIKEFCDGCIPGIPEFVSQFQRKYTALRAQSLHPRLPFPLNPPRSASSSSSSSRPRRNVHHMEKQSAQRFTTGILTQRGRQRRRVKAVGRSGNKAVTWGEGVSSPHIEISATHYFVNRGCGVVLFLALTSLL